MYNKFNYKGDKNMKVFISWSGDVSFQVATVLKEWIPCVIQDVEPYFSSEDIDKGARWSTDIARELESAAFGILCVTKDNLESKWLNFEAGALSKAIDKSKVCPLLYHLKPSDITDSPILQFQMTNVEKQDIFKLFKTINVSLGENGLEEARLEKVFGTFWPEMESAFSSIKEEYEKENTKDVGEENTPKILEEMLELLRSQQMILKNPEKIMPIEYIQEALAESTRISRKQIQEMVPHHILMDLKKSEETLNSLILGRSETNEELLDAIKAELRNYITINKRILKLLGLLYPGYSIYIEK